MRATDEQVGAGGAWDAPLDPGALATLAWKYAALDDALAKAGAPRSRALRRVAARCPGALRETQLVPPARMAARRSASRLGVSQPARSRGWWRAQGLAALPLWAALHELLGDQLLWRRGVGRARCRDPELFMAHVAARGGRVRERWPATAGALVAVAGPRVSPRQAYLWLAHLHGLTLPALNLILFERAGPWDRRRGDPAWARGVPSDQTA